MDVACFRCGCRGKVEASGTDAVSVARPSTCQCADCATAGCAYFSIRNCIACGEPCTLRLNGCGETFYHCRLKCMHTEPPKRFLRLRNRDINLSLPPWNRTLLHSAVIASDLQLMWHLLSLGANPYAKDCRGVTPIDIAHFLLASITHKPSASTAEARSPPKPNDLASRIQSAVAILPDLVVAEAASEHIPDAPVLGRGGSDPGLKPTDAPFTNGALPIPPKNHRFISAPLSTEDACGSVAASVVEVSIAKASRAIDIKRGTQPFTPITLARLTSGNDISPMIPLDIGHTKCPPSGVNIEEWKRSELCHLIAEQEEIHVQAESFSKTFGAEAADVLFNCTACYDRLPIEKMRYCCNRLGCSGCLCADCITQLVFVTVTSGLYAVPSVRCPGTCMHRIPTAVWRGSLRSDPAPPDMHETISRLLSLDMNSCYDSSMTAEQLLMERYTYNAEALLMIRCSACDSTQHLFYTDRNGHEIMKTVENRLSFLEQFINCHFVTTDLALYFLQALVRYYNGEIPADMIARLVVDASCSRSGVDNSIFSSDEPLDDSIVEEVKLFLCCVVDIERRLCLQLAIYRLYPKILTPCCCYPHCFMCKVEGHHEGQTCEEVQQKEAGVEVQYCSGCGVPTLRTEGCSDILCVCGYNWKWQGDEEDF